MPNQRTLASEVSLKGVGLHTGEVCEITFKPAPPNTWFVCKSKNLGKDVSIPAKVEFSGEELIRGTVLEKDGVTVYTVEHVLAALYGLQIDNCIIELSGPEPPVMDGSIKAFIDAIKKAGIVEQDIERMVLDVDEVIQFADSKRKTDIHIIPFDGFRITLMIDYANRALGTQYTTLVSLESELEDEFAAARTFCFLSEVEELREQDLIKGGALDSAIVILDKEFTENDEEFFRKKFNISDDVKIFAGENGTLNNIQLRYYNEPVRHKLVDLLGDLALLGMYIKGHVIGARSGHAANVALVHELKKFMDKKKLAGKFGKGANALLDITAIQKILPHRSPFLLVDKVIDFEGGKFALAIKNVTFNEPFFQGHFPEHPVMPGVLIIEAIAQTGGFLLMQTVADPDNSVTYFMGLDKVRFRKPVTPGDQLILRVDMISYKRGICKFKGIATVDGKVVCEGEFMATVMPKEKQ